MLQYGCIFYGIGHTFLDCSYVCEVLRRIEEIKGWKFSFMSHWMSGKWLGEGYPPSKIQANEMRSAVQLQCDIYWKNEIGRSIKSLKIEPVAILRSIMVGILDFNGANEPDNRCGNAIKSKMLVGVFDTMEEVVQVFCDCGMQD